MEWFEELLDYSYSIARRIAKLEARRNGNGRHGYDDSMLDDYISAAHLGLVRALRTFDLAHGVDIFTYAGACVRNACLMVRRRAKRRQFAPDDFRPPVDRASRVYERLSELRQKEVVKAICAGQTDYEMSCRFGIPRREMVVIADEVRSQMLPILLEEVENVRSNESKIRSIYRSWKNGE